MSKKIGTVLALVIFIGTVYTAGCSQKQEIADKSPVKTTQNTVVDQNGREIVIPEKADRLIMTALPLPSAYALTGEPVEKIVGMHPGAKGAIANSIMGKMHPELLKVETSFVEGTDLNIEQLLKLKPDLVFYWGDYQNQHEQLEKAGVPAIGVKTQGEGDALYTLETWLEIYGKVFSRDAEIKEVIKYGREVLKEIEDKTARIKDEERVKTLVLFQHGEKEITVPGTGHYGQFWIETTGGYNVAREINVTANVNMEQIYKWDPQIVFISSFTDTMPEDLYQNKIKGQDWSKVDAVKNKRVYKIPVGVYRWYPPSGDAPLMLKWVAQHQYPEIFTYDMEKEVKEYYQEFYNYQLTTEEAQSILNTKKEASQGTRGQFSGQK